MRMIKFHTLPILHYQNTVSVNYCCQSMSDDEDSRVGEALLQLLLDHIVSFEVYVSCGFV